MRPTSVTPLVVFCAVALTSYAHAQSSDSVTFRSGEWGADFQVTGGFAGAGGLRFLSPTQAWLLDLGATFAHSANAQSGSASTSNNLSLSAKVGRRRYAVVAHRVAPWVAFGLTVAYNWDELVVQDTVQGRSRGLGGGVFGTLGATWFVTPHLGLGAQWGLNVLYNHTHATIPQTTSTFSSNTFRASFPNMALVGQLYF
jgi:hypothetical protein